jgi:hypothetical protein
MFLQALGSNAFKNFLGLSLTAKRCNDRYKAGVGKDF